MAAEVRCVHRVGGDDGKATAPKDLLASNFSLDNSQELDLDLHVPFGWEKRLDLKSGRVYLQRSCNSPTSSLDQKQPFPKLQDLNFPKPLLNIFHDSTSLDLKLASSGYQSVCTLDKVKSALQRAEREPAKKRSTLSPPYSYSSSSSSIQDADQEERPVAAGCPGCLSYVLIVSSRPQCPRCGTLVPLPPVKRPCIDLNISI